MPFVTLQSKINGNNLAYIACRKINNVFFRVMFASLQCINLGRPAGVMCRNDFGGVRIHTLGLLNRVHRL